LESTIKPTLITAYDRTATAAVAVKAAATAAAVAAASAALTASAILAHNLAHNSAYQIPIYEEQKQKGKQKETEKEKEKGDARLSEAAKYSQQKFGNASDLELERLVNSTPKRITKTKEMHDWNKIADLHSATNATSKSCQNRWNNWKCCMLSLRQTATHATETSKRTEHTTTQPSSVSVVRAASATGAKAVMFSQSFAPPGTVTGHHNATYTAHHQTNAQDRGHPSESTSSSSSAEAAEFYRGVAKTQWGFTATIRTVSIIMYHTV